MVVGQPRSALVAAALLIAACGSPSTPATTDGAAVPVDEGTAVDASYVTPDIGVAPDGNVGPAQMDAHGDARRASAAWDAASASDTGADAAAPLFAGPPAPWQGENIGAVGHPGQTAVGPGWFRIGASGGAIGDRRDACYFVHQAWTGDGALVARVAAVAGALDPASQVGVMIRASLDDDAASAVLVVAGDGSGGHLQFRATKGGATMARPADGTVKPGQYLRLVRSGTTVTADVSPDRASWTRIGTATLELGDTAYLGLAVAGHDVGAPFEARFNYATLDNLAGDPALAGWAPLDVGTLGATARATDGKLALDAFGAPFTAAQDSFSAVVRSASDNLRLTVRVDLPDSGDPDARVGLMLREGSPSTTTRTAAFALIGLTSARGVEFASRAARDGTTLAGARQAAIKTAVWLRLEKRAAGTTMTQLTGWYSIDGSTWTMLDSATVAIADPLTAGLFASSGAAGTRAHVEVSALAVAALDDATADAAAPVARPDSAIAPLAPSRPDGGANDAAPPDDAGARDAAAPTD